MYLSRKRPSGWTPVSFKLKHSGVGDRQDKKWKLVLRVCYQRWVLRLRVAATGYYTVEMQLSFAFQFQVQFLVVTEKGKEEAETQWWDLNFVSLHLDLCHSAIFPKAQWWRRFCWGFPFFEQTYYVVWSVGDFSSKRTQKKYYFFQLFKCVKQQNGQKGSADLCLNVTSWKPLISWQTNEVTVFNQNFLCCDG